MDPALKALLNDDDDSGFIFCAACSHVLGKATAAIEINGSHNHFCTNPHGFDFHVRCFSQALGCAIAGQPTAADSWFPSYRWRYASCGGCGVHLGWLFVGNDGQFYGLIHDRIQLEA